MKTVFCDNCQKPYNDVYSSCPRCKEPKPVDEALQAEGKTALFDYIKENIKHGTSDPTSTEDFENLFYNP